jgi:hypothetical protein
MGGGLLAWECWPILPPDQPCMVNPLCYMFVPLLSVCCFAGLMERMWMTVLPVTVAGYRHGSVGLFHRQISPAW